MNKLERFVTLVQTEVLYECMKGLRQVNPGAVVSMAMEVPYESLSNNPQELYAQALELVAWFYGGPDPMWMPEDLLYEEVIEEYYEEIDDEDYEDWEEEPFFDESAQSDSESESDSDSETEHPEPQEQYHETSVEIQEEFDHNTGYA